jgi:hypothetical protein
VTGLDEATPLVTGGIRAAVRVAGHRYQLVWHLHPQPGMTVEFLERMAGGALATIATVHSAHGHMTFHPAAGAAGRRALLAQIMVNQIPRSADLVVGQYDAPRPSLPHVRDAHYDVVRGVLRVSWKPPSAGASGYELELRFSDSAQSLAAVHRSPARATLPAGLTLRSVRIITQYDGMHTVSTTATKSTPARGKRHSKHKTKRHRR